MKLLTDNPRVQFWEDYIVCQNGKYIYVDKQGSRHPITHEEARKKERDFHAYQAQMDIQRGGMDRDAAYGSRGFTPAGSGWEYQNYQVDRLR